MARLTRRGFLRASVAVGSGSIAMKTWGAEGDLAARARATLARSTGFFRSIGTNGGYLWSYSPDLQDRRGETKATPTQIWVQPPGTPSVGSAFLRCWEVTGDAAHLEAARAAAGALAYGQLESGGWHYMIDFDPAADNKLRRAIAATLPPAQRARRRNVTTFDDDTTQSAVRYLLAVTRTKGPADADPKRAADVAGALDYALAHMLKAQYPNGAFPQAYMGQPRNAAEFPAVKASLPKDWRDLPKVKDYWFHYTLNDNTHSDCLKTLLEAHRATGKADYLDAARRGAQFLLAAQLPAPQPAWAQQYTPDMKPAWARKFEPPAVCSLESVGAIRTLVDLHLATGDPKLLDPIPAALAWLEKVKLPDGRHARFYELNTDKPLYMTRQYEVTYADDDLPTHYGFKTSPPLASATKYYEAVKAGGRDAYLAREAEREKAEPTRRGRRAADLAPRVEAVCAALDEKGRWLDKDGRIACGAFVQNVNLLCDYVAAVG